MSQLTDGFGRSFPYLRLSLTEACNFRCSYCLPDGYQADGRPRFLQVDEIARLVRAFAALGMSKIRLTGGEPSLRKDLDEIIATVAAVPGVRKVAITTNGTLLPRRLPGWHRAGLTALNVSMDSLQRERFKTITGHDRLPEIEQGLALAQALGLPAIKLNAVLLRGLNDDELPQWMDYLRDRPFSVRFIELMRTGDNEAYFQRHHLRADVVIEQL
ncbi:MAG: radical SAM protein, partial [Stenotrophomonas sp.]